MLRWIITPLALAAAVLCSAYASTPTKHSAFSDYLTEWSSQKTFQVPATNLTGHVMINTSNPLYHSVVYMHKAPDYLITDRGTIISKENGVVATRKVLLNHYTQDEIAKHIKTFHGFTKGSKDNSPHIYVFVNPRCGYCQKLKAALKSEIDAGRVNVTYIPVAILRGSQTATVQELQNETQLSEKDAKTQVIKNTQLYVQLGGRSVPAIFYFNKKQQPMLIPGNASPESFLHQVADASVTK